MGWAWTTVHRARILLLGGRRDPCAGRHADTCHGACRRLLPQIPRHRAGLADGRAADMAVLTSWSPCALAEANQRGRLVAEAANARRLDVLVLAHAHAIGFVRVAATCPRRPAADRARRAGTPYGAALAEQLRLVVCVEIAGRRVVCAAWREALRRAASDADALETCQARDAVVALGLGGVALMGEMTAVAVFDRNRGELRHGRRRRVGRAPGVHMVSRCCFTPRWSLLRGVPRRARVLRRRRRQINQRGCVGRHCRSFDWRDSGDWCVYRAGAGAEESWSWTCDVVGQVGAQRTQGNRDLRRAPGVGHLQRSTRVALQSKRDTGLHAITICNCFRPLAYQCRVSP